MSTWRRCAATSRPRGCSGCPNAASATTRRVLDMDLGTVEPSVAGPKRPQDRIALSRLKEQFLSLLTSADGYGKSPRKSRAR